MQFYFIRHGQSVNNALWDRTLSSVGRVHDPELSDTGRKQADLLGAYLAQPDAGQGKNGRDPKNLAGFGITHLYSSLMLRAIQTGDAISKAIGLPLAAWVDAHEEGGIYLEDETTGLRQGYPGVSQSYLQEHFPAMQLPADWTAGGWWDRPYEDREERRARARRFYEELLRRHAGGTDRVVIVSHGGFYNLFLQVILAYPPDSRIWFSLNNVAITRIDFLEDVVVTYMNRSDFLPADLVT